MSRRLKLLLGAGALLAAVVAGGLWWFFRDDSPPPVSLGTAVESVGDGAATTSGGGISGTWTVDSVSGDFDFETATGTFAGFRVNEELTGIGSNTAVGRTGDVEGSLTIESTTVSTANFEVDLSTITTNDSLRDGRVQEALETDAHPDASFVLTEPIALDADAASGVAVSATAVGDLTIHGVTRSVEIAIDAQLVESTIVLVGSTEVVFADYGVETPTSPLVLSVEDHGILEFQLLLTRETTL